MDNHKIAEEMIRIAKYLLSYSSNLEKGDKLQHSRQDSISIELVEPTKKGWRVKETETFANKRMKPKIRTKFYNKQDIEGSRAFFRKKSASSKTAGNPEEFKKYIKFFEVEDAEGPKDGRSIAKFKGKKFRYPIAMQKMLELFDPPDSGYYKVPIKIHLRSGKTLRGFRYDHGNKEPNFEKQLDNYIKRSIKETPT